MLSTVLFCLERCRVQPKGAKQQKKNHTKNTVFSVAFCRLSQLPCEPVCCHFYTKHLWWHCWKTPREQLSAGQVNLKSCWEELILLFYLFRNRTTVCTEVDDYLSTSFLPILFSLPEKRTRAWFLFPVFLPICRFCLAGTTVRWEGIWKDRFYTWQVCSVSGWERKGVCHCWKSLLHLKCQENPPKSFFLCEMLHMVKLIPLSRIALYIFFLYLLCCFNTESYAEQVKIIPVL